jgi:hypothetical protein
MIGSSEKNEEWLWNVFITQYFEKKIRNIFIVIIITARFAYLYLANRNKKYNQVKSNKPFKIV